MGRDGVAAAPPRDFYRNGTSLPSLGPRPYVSAIVMSYNHKGNIAKIAELLHAEPGVGEIVVTEDGSTDGSPETWRAHLAPRDKLVASADVHEIRAYNGGARAATGAVYCFLQDDDLPDDADDSSSNSLLRMLKAGDYFGERALLTDAGRRKASVVARTDSVILVITREAFLETFSNQVGWAPQVARTVLSTT